MSRHTTDAYGSLIQRKGDIMRRILIVLAIVAAFFSTVFTSAASAYSPGTLYAYSDVEITFTLNSCVDARAQLILETSYVGVVGTDTFNMSGWDHCAGQDVFLIQGGSNDVAGVSFDTYGMTMNSTFRGYDFMSSTDKSYDLWFNLRLKCVDTTQRMHPGVACTGRVSGTLAFSKYRMTAPPSAGGYLYWNTTSAS